MSFLRATWDMKVASVLPSFWVSKRAFSNFNALSWSCVTSQHRSSSSTIKSMPSSRINASSMTTSAAVQLPSFTCLKSHPSCRFLRNDDVASYSRRSPFHRRHVYAGVGAEKLGGGSCPKRGPTAVSSSTLSQCLAMVSSHAGLHYQLWISRLNTLSNNNNLVTRWATHQHTNKPIIATIAKVQIICTRIDSIVILLPPTHQHRPKCCCEVK